MDRLIFLRNGMHEALVCRWLFPHCSAVTQFEQRRVRHFWQLELDKRRRTLLLYGVSDQFVARRRFFRGES